MLLQLPISRRHFWTIALPVTLALMVGCGPSDGVVTGTSGTSVERIMVMPASASVEPQHNVQFRAYARTAKGDSVAADVQWRTSRGAISTSGLYTADSAAGSLLVIGTDPRNGFADTANVSVVSIVAPATPRKGYYVSPAGSVSGTGTIDNPWTLATALAGGSGRIQPGDTVWLRGGTYQGAAYRSVLTGSSRAPIVVRQFPGERAVLDAAGATSSTSRGDFFVVQGSYVIYWGFELMDSNPNRTSSSRPNMLINDGPNNSYVNLVVHDGGVGFYTYANTATGVEINGCLFYDNGWQGPGWGEGHALYLKSDAGPLVARDNIMFNQFGYGTQVYSNFGDGQLNNITLDGNVAFNNGVLATQYATQGNANLLIGGEEPARQGRLTNNMTYFSPGVGYYNIVLGLEGYANQDVVFTDNYLAGGAWGLTVGVWSQITSSRNTIVGGSGMVGMGTGGLASYSWNGNAYWRDPTARAWDYTGTSYNFAAWSAATGLGASDQASSGVPSGTRVFVRRNAYEDGRANVVVYNWSHAGAVTADLGTVLTPGDRYEVRNVQDYFGQPVLSGTFDGGAISIPMNGVNPPAPIGGSPHAAPRTGPDFDVFVVSRIS